MDDTAVTVVGGGLAGLVAAVTVAEAGVPVVLREAHENLGGRARSSPPPCIANDGPHVLYADGALWSWLVDHGLSQPARRLPLGAVAAIRFRRAGRLRATPPAGLARLLAGRRQHAPVDVDFRRWVEAAHGPDVAATASAFAGVVTFAADPGALSAAFVWERLLRATNPRGGPRYVVGGWGELVERLACLARDLEVRIETARPVTEVPAGPCVIATALPAARTLLGRELATPATSGSTALLDVAVERRRREPFLVSDLDESGWVEAFSRADRSLAPTGTVLVQAQRPVAAGESRAAAQAALGELVELAVPGWRERARWQREATAHHRTGALDLPGYTWRDRPQIDQGDGLFLAGDEVAAPGLLSEVSFHSARSAAAAATQHAAGAGVLSGGRPRRAGGRG